MDKKEKKSLPEPRTYTVEQIAAMLNIGRTTAYQLVKGEKVQRVGRTTKHTLPQTVFGLGLIGSTVGFLLSADKGADFLDALGVAGGKHLRHLNDPVALQLGKHLVIIQLF